MLKAAPFTAPRMDISTADAVEMSIAFRQWRGLLASYQSVLTAELTRLQTIRWLLSDAEQFVEYLEVQGITPDTLSTQILNAYQISLSDEQGYAPTTTRRKLSAVRKFITYAQQFWTIPFSTASLLLQTRVRVVKAKKPRRKIQKPGHFEFDLSKPSGIRDRAIYYLLAPNRSD
jgi:site-specific recombinase XerD